jgi:putative pyruvate formate lyase activating enzyme
MMLALQERGCHNINLVTPEHVVPQILEALLIAAEDGLRLPLVYNTGTYDSLESIRLMEGVIDIYMPDFKFWDPTMARRYLHAPDYPEVARQAVKEMHRQVGPLVVDDKGAARRGLLLRHLVMPDDISGTCHIMRWVARELGTDTYVNIMPQYHPAGKVSEAQYPEINRCLTHKEFRHAIQAAREAGLFRLDVRSARQARIVGD